LSQGLWLVESRAGRLDQVADSVNVRSSARLRHVYGLAESTGTGFSGPCRPTRSEGYVLRRYR